MSKIATRVAAAVFLLGTLPLSVAACASDESSIFVRAVLAPDRAKCSALADPNSPFYTQGSMDLAYARTYDAFLLVGNQLVQRGNATQVRTETNRVEFFETSVDVRLPDNLDSIPVENGQAWAWTETTPGFADPSMGQTIAYGIVTPTLVKDFIANHFLKDLRNHPGSVARVVAFARVRGKTLGGDTLETGVFQFPIDLCYACSCTNLGVKNCNDSTDKPDANCRPGLDGPTDCRYGSIGGNHLCNQL